MDDAPIIYGLEDFQVNVFYHIIVILDYFYDLWNQYIFLYNRFTIEESLNTLLLIKMIIITWLIDY